MTNLQAKARQALTILAPAKLNLSLHILSKRPDSYHELSTLFQSIDLCDSLQFTFSPAEKDELEIRLHESTGCDAFPLDNSNIIKKAAAVYRTAAPTSRSLRVAVLVRKNIPLGAGLAGGSANAAATLLAMNHYERNKLAFNQLMELAAQIGSDVPFSFNGGTCLGQGRGEILSSLPAQDQLVFVLVKPKAISVSTAWAYDAFDRNRGSAQNDPAILEDQRQEMIARLGNRDIVGAAKLFNNSFEPVVFDRYPVLRAIKERLIALGCLCSHMTGSGPTIYGLANDLAQAKRVLASIKEDQSDTSSEAWYKDYGFEADAWLVRSISHGIKVIENEEAREKN